MLKSELSAKSRLLEDNTGQTERKQANSRRKTNNHVSGEVTFTINLDYGRKSKQENLWGNRKLRRQTSTSWFKTQCTLKQFLNVIYNQDYLCNYSTVYLFVCLFVCLLPIKYFSSDKIIPVYYHLVLKCSTTPADMISQMFVETHRQTIKALLFMIMAKSF